MARDVDIGRILYSPCLPLDPTAGNPVSQGTAPNTVAVVVHDRFLHEHIIAHDICTHSTTQPSDTA